MTVHTEPQAGAPDAGLLGIATGLLGSGRGRWSQRLATSIAVAAVVQRGHAWWTKAQTDRQFTVAVFENDEIWDTLHRRLLDMIPEDRRRVLVATTKRPGALPDHVRVPDRSVRLHYDGSRPQRVIFDGQAVSVAVERLYQQTGSDSGISQWLPAKIIFTARTLAGRRAVERFLAEVAAEHEKIHTAPALRLADRWSQWNHIGPVPRRPLDTVILPDGTMDRLVSELGEFLAAESDYTRIGVPWHHGILLHGPPGTGKSSTVKALAGHFGLDVHILSVNDVPAEANLAHLVGSIQGPAFLLLEDMDTVAAARDRDHAPESGKGITLSPLLQALDGVATPDGMITVISTNRPEALDSALVRPGRIDQRVEFRYVDHDQLRRLLLTFTGYAHGIDGIELPDDLTHAQIIDVLKRNLRDPGAAVAQVRQLVGAL